MVGRRASGWVGQHKRAPPFETIDSAMQRVVAHRTRTWALADRPVCAALPAWPPLGRPPARAAQHGPLADGHGDHRGLSGVRPGSLGGLGGCLGATPCVWAGVRLLPRCWLQLGDHTLPSPTQPAALAAQVHFLFGAFYLLIVRGLQPSLASRPARAPHLGSGQTPASKAFAFMNWSATRASCPFRPAVGRGPSHRLLRLLGHGPGADLRVRQQRQVSRALL
jgi:hypothetical protein